MSYHVNREKKNLAMMLKSENNTAAASAGSKNRINFTDCM